MRAGTKCYSFSSIAPEPAWCLHIVGAQEILLDKWMNLQGPGEQGMGDGGEGAPGRGLEEAAGALGSDEVQFGQSEGPVDGAVGYEAGTVVGRPEATPGRAFVSPGVDTKCLGAYVRPVAVFLELRAKL